MTDGQFVDRRMKTREVFDMAQAAYEELNRQHRANGVYRDYNNIDDIDSDDGGDDGDGEDELVSSILGAVNSCGLTVSEILEATEDRPTNKSRGCSVRSSVVGEGDWRP